MLYMCCWTVGQFVNILNSYNLKYSIKRESFFLVFLGLALFARYLSLILSFPMEFVPRI